MLKPQTRNAGKWNFAGGRPEATVEGGSWWISGPVIPSEVVSFGIPITSLNPAMPGTI